MIPAKIIRIFWYLELIPKLGIRDVLYVIYYRILLKSGIYQKNFPVTKLDLVGQVFNKCEPVKDFPHQWKVSLIEQADKILNGELSYFSYHWMKQSDPPNWFRNPFNGKECLNLNEHWTQISDFNSNLGDIKNIWEPSRFTWVGILARAYAVSGNDQYLKRINDWVGDWVSKNPVNQGPNWKCGQETSFRIFNLLNAAQILDQAHKPTDNLKEIISHHLSRVSLNNRYATAQRNNHSTSEAAALFIGGSWLAETDPSNQKQYMLYAEKGRNSLEHLLKSLVYEDGSFAQHSANYHRLFIDTLSLVIFWTHKLDLKPFTSDFHEIAKKSTRWLLSIMDNSGNSPNLGSNDGTMLQANHSCDYQDYRPSLQTASALIDGHMVFGSGPWDEPLYWYEIKKENLQQTPFIKKTEAQGSGYVIMNCEKSWALLRFPYYKFRPSHNDAFHFDLWADGKNILFDSGSFSYNPDHDSVVPDLKSVHSHNTVSFDHNEQMPRLGRFLLGKWLKPLTITKIEQAGQVSGTWEGSYRDYVGNVHLRKIKWYQNGWEIIDRLSGKSRNAEIGFNFERCNYSLEVKNNMLLLPWGKIVISDSTEMKVVDQMKSDYYQQSSLVNRLVISVQNNSEITTSITIF
jgi:hypothetical protein